MKPKSSVLRIILVLILIIQLFNCSYIQAQKPQNKNKTQDITGFIIDSKTQNPIPHTEVFISGTTSGCISDSLGYFKLKIPHLPCTLVADHVSYESFIKTLESIEEIKIELSSSNFSLHEVSISGKNKRKKNLRYFYSHFIKENHDKIKILNDSVLIFQRDKMKFEASSNEPLILINNYLGYRIKLVLEEFEVICLDAPNGKQIPLNSMNGGEVMQLTGYYFYEPLEKQNPEKDDYFKINRSNSYYGSYRHFLKSIYDNEPEKQGYKIEVSPSDQEAAFYKVEEESLANNNQKFVILANSLKVHYRFDDNKFPIPEEYITGRYFYNQRESIIYPTTEPFIIRANGTSPKLTFIIDGLMVTKSFANSLPEDYIPPTR